MYASSPLRDTPGTPSPTLRFPVNILISPPAPNGVRVMFPVPDPPKARVWELVVPRLPAPVRKVLLLAVPADMDAVGVPELTFMNAKSADAVEVPPKSRSKVDASLG